MLAIVIVNLKHFQFTTTVTLFELSIQHKRTGLPSYPQHIQGFLWGFWGNCINLVSNEMIIITDKLD